MFISEDFREASRALAKGMELAAQIHGPGFAHEERIGPGLELEVADADRADDAAGLVRSLEHDDVGRLVPLQEPIRDRQTGDAGPDHDDPSVHDGGASFSARCSRTTSASIDVNAGSALGISVRANAIPAASAIARTSMSRS